MVAELPLDLSAVGRRLSPEQRRVADRLLDGALLELEVEHERLDEGVYRAVLDTGLDVPAKPRTGVWLVTGDHGVVVESLFVRAPERRHADVYAALLQRNARARLLHFALDQIGDVYLRGTLPYEALDTDEVDGALGEVMAAVEELWPPVLAAGFGVSDVALPGAAGKWGMPGDARRPTGTPLRTPEADPRR